MKLLTRLFLLVGIALVPSIVLETYNQFELYRAELETVNQEAKHGAMRFAFAQDQQTEAARQLLGAIASLEEVKRQDTAACNARLAVFVKEYPDYEFLGVVDRQGVRFCSSGIPFPGRVSMAGFSFYKPAVRTGKFVVGGYRISIVRKVPVLEFGRPYFDAAGALQGVVYAGLSLDHMNAQLARQPLPPSARVIIADRNGTIIASIPHRRWIGKELPRWHLDRLGEDRIGTANMPGLDGRERLYGYVPVAASPGDGVYVAYGLDQRTALADVRRAVERGVCTAAGGIAAAVLISLWYGRRYIRRPVSLLLNVCEEWRRGKWQVRAPIGPITSEFEQIARGFNQMAETVQDELARRAQAEALLAKSHTEIIEASEALSAHADIVRHLATMGQRLQSCTSDEEMADAVGRFAPQILPGIPGALCVLSNSRNLVRVMATWNAPAGLEADFAPLDCWALRRGQVHTVDNVAHEVVCTHVSPDKVAGYSCRPLIAQGEPIGLLYLETAKVNQSDFDAFAENISLALGNQRLREKLRDQSIRDPLTGLFNRRYFEEALELDFARAARHGLSLSLIMGDVDRFKQFNDRFGHDAGDLVLKRTAEAMRAKIRRGDLACRYGGEEFLILLHDAGLSEARERAETIREAVKAMDFSFRGQALGPVTISLGVAVYPDHASDGASLITAADSAMYAAKHSGRDQVRCAGSGPEESDRGSAKRFQAASAEA
ncbi:MAG TPA: diguanylate cyclase [Stellaceae bacterium]|nr:diguanylate cyclase [Stellaceae bacterium]